jgi:SAM-dependent methyltransferase
LNDDLRRLRDRVRTAYSAAAVTPDSRHPFPVGAEFAGSVGYPDELIRELPAESSAAFAGVSNVSVRAPLREGMRVLDVGCGAGLDSLVAARKVGGSGWVLGIDFSEEMLARARRAARGAQTRRVWFVRAGAEQLPLAEASVDAALVNGIFNLNPYREAIFLELGRVVRPGGQVAGAELVLDASLPESLRAGDVNWFS